MTTNNQKILDDIVEYANNLDFTCLLDDDCDCDSFSHDEHRPLTPKEVHRLRKKEELAKLLKYLEAVISQLDMFNDKKYYFKSIHETQSCNSFLTYNGARLYSLLDIEIYNNFTLMVKDESFIKEIKDKKFQSYVSVRKKLDALRKKITPIPECDYLVAQIMKVNAKLDQYISTYLISLLINANKEHIVNYYKEDYRKRKSHHKKNVIGHGMNDRKFGGL